jgi:hypothetical protein
MIQLFSALLQLVLGHKHVAVIVPPDPPDPNLVTVGGVTVTDSAVPVTATP